MKIVKFLDQNGGERFLADEPMTASWVYPKAIDVYKVEEEEDSFFDLFSTYLGSMKHKKLKFRESGEAQSVRHSTIKKFCTALNYSWSKIPRKLPFRLAALCADMKSEKKKDVVHNNQRSLSTKFKVKGKE